MADVGSKEAHVLWAEGEREMGGRQQEKDMETDLVLGSGIIT